MNNKKTITEKELAEQLKCIIKEEILAIFSEEQNGLTLSFLNGQ